MSEPKSALGGAVSEGFVTIREIGPVGMITLRAKPDAAGLAKAVKAAVGTGLPEVRRIVTEGDRACGWMSPDEYLLVLPYAAVGGALEAIGKAMAGAHHLAVDVSDARRVPVEGQKPIRCWQAVAVDFGALAPAELRRTRAAQVRRRSGRMATGLPCLLPVGGTLCVRSAGDRAMPGSELG